MESGGGGGDGDGEETCSLKVGAGGLGSDGWAGEGDIDPERRVWVGSLEVDADVEASSRNSGAEWEIEEVRNLRKKIIPAWGVEEKK